MSNEMEVSAPQEIVEGGELTGIHTCASKVWPTNLRFLRKGDGQLVLQEQWEITENNYDAETSYTSKQWRDVPSTDAAPLEVEVDAES